RKSSTRTVKTFARAEEAPRSPHPGPVATEGCPGPVRLLSRRFGDLHRCTVPPTVHRSFGCGRLHAASASRTVDLRPSCTDPGELDGLEVCDSHRGIPGGRPRYALFTCHEGEPQGNAARGGQA